MLDNAAVAILLIDEQQRCVYMNAAAEALTGYSLAEANNRPLRDVIHHRRPDGSPCASETCPIERAFEQGKRAQGEGIFGHKDGHVYPVAYCATPIREGFRGTIIEVRDIAAEKSKNEANELLINEINHRAKNALAVVQGIVRLTRGGTLAEYQAAVTGRVNVLARAHTLLARENWEGAPLRGVVDDVLRAQPRSDAFIPEGPEVLLTASAVQPIGLLLHELATNAAKYGSLTSPEGKVSLSWSAKPDIGLELLWREAGGPEIAAPSRTGFGSSLLRQLARQLGGDIAFEWNKEGLTAQIFLSPKAYTNSAAPSAAERGLPLAARTPQPQMRKGRVLVLEDNVTIGLGMNDLLRGAGLDVLGPAMNFEEAMAHVLNSRFDAAFLDIDLYGHPSFEVADALAGRNIPFVFCTGHGDLVRRSRHHGRRILRKPVSDEEVLAAFDEMVLARG